MKNGGKIPNHPRVALLVESSFGYGRELLMGIAKYVRIHGNWSIDFEEGDPSERLPTWFNRREWDGLIARVKSPEMAAIVAKHRVPLVDLSGSLPDHPFPVIRSDEDAVGCMAAEHLLERGFKRFAFCGFEGVDWSDARRVGFENRLSEAGFTCQTFSNKRLARPNLTAEYEEHEDRHERELKRWLKSLPKPIGVMACNDSRGRQVINCCRDLGAAIPDEIAVIGVDKDDIFCELSGIPLSSVILNAQQIGFEAAALLNQLMSGEPNETDTILVKPVGVAMRQSTDVLAIEDTHVSNALRLIRTHACEGLDVEALLESIPLSRSVLERRFARLLNTSPKAEILRARLNRVRQLLKESDLSLTEIAEKSGFEYPEYMSRLFKSKMGITPGEFRRQSAPEGHAPRKRK